MVGHGGSSAGSYLADPTFPIPSHCASIVVTSTLRAKLYYLKHGEVLAVLCHLCSGLAVLLPAQVAWVHYMGLARVVYSKYKKRLACT